MPGKAGAERANAAPSAAIYIHFPFCRYLCTYCDFDAFAGKEALIEAYVDAAVRQIASSPPARATSLYLGGGTPSLMDPRHAAALVQACREAFDLPAEAEATFEANPSGLSVARLEGFREAGFNRLSLGVQSTDGRLLRLLGRRHTAEDARIAVEMARGAGFRNLSLDLIYGVPRQEMTAWRETLDAAVGWGVEHVSCYMLTVEPGTPMERGLSRGSLAAPPDDEVVAMYEVARELLGGADYRRYEISNWSRPGYQSAHNLTYWRNLPYLGMGAGAASCWGGRRYKILGHIERYLDGVGLGALLLSEDEVIDARYAMSDTLLLGLRLEEGVSRQAFLDRHGVPPEDAFGEALCWAQGLGLLVRTGDILRLTDRGFLFSNELFSRLV